MSLVDEVNAFIALAEREPLTILNMYIKTQQRLDELEKIATNLIGGDSNDLSGVMSYLVKYNVAQKRSDARKKR